MQSLRKEVDRRYFFERLQNPLWIAPLNELGVFKLTPPQGGANEYSQIPNYPELRYLCNVCTAAPDEVVGILLDLPAKTNYRVCNLIIEIAIKLDFTKSEILLDKISEGIGLSGTDMFMVHDLIRSWPCVNRKFLDFLKVLVEFAPDSRQKEKEEMRRKDPSDIFTSLTPHPKFDLYHYKEILINGVVPLATKAPLQIALVLRDAVYGMIQMGINQAELESSNETDSTEWLLPQFGVCHRTYDDSREILINALVVVSERVFECDVESDIETFDRILRRERRGLFFRVREHLYAAHLTDQTLPWIKEIILHYEDYAERPYTYEFARMARLACEHFKERLLSPSELEGIVEKIKSGPSREREILFLGADFNETNFAKYTRHTHLRHLYPFASLLTGEALNYFKDLNAEAPVTDDSFTLIHGTTKSGFVSDKSPLSSEEMATKTDQELLEYITTWNDEHFSDSESFIRISRPALANEFQKFFLEKIAPDSQRVSFWLKQKEETLFPKNLESIFSALCSYEYKTGFALVSRVFTLAQKILEHPEVEIDGDVDSHNETDVLGWISVRRAVKDFLKSCFKDEINAPFSIRKDCLALLRTLCSQNDARLDSKENDVLIIGEYLTDGINSTRGQSLELVFSCANWIRRYEKDDELKDVLAILNSRLGSSAQIPLTLPEYAILGLHIENLCWMSASWVIEHKKSLFPDNNREAWSVSFGTYISYTSPKIPIFMILKEDYDYAVNHIERIDRADPSEKKQDKNSKVERLAQHIFILYLWGKCELGDKTGLIARFYQNTDTAREYWASLFNYVGHTLSQSGSELEGELVTRVKAFFEWRLQSQCSEELQNFSFWLSSKCLDPKWRLEAYAKTLDFGLGRDFFVNTELKTLRELLDEHPALVVECFLKLTRKLTDTSAGFLDSDNAKQILHVGFSRPEEKVRRQAEEARDNLLNRGRFDYLEKHATPVSST